MPGDDLADAFMGRRPLPAQERDKHRLDSRQRYEERKLEKRRADAKERMRKFRLSLRLSKNSEKLRDYRARERAATRKYQERHSKRSSETKQQPTRKPQQPKPRKAAKSSTPPDPAAPALMPSTPPRVSRSKDNAAAQPVSSIGSPSRSTGSSHSPQVLVPDTPCPPSRPTGSSPHNAQAGRQKRRIVIPETPPGIRGQATTRVSPGSRPAHRPSRSASPAPKLIGASTLLQRLDKDRRRLTKLASLGPRAPSASRRQAPRRNTSTSSSQSDQDESDSNDDAPKEQSGSELESDDEKWIDEHADFHRIRWNFSEHPEEGPCAFSGCSESSCPGCACICTATNVWVRHWGGHHRRPPRGSIFG
uniref:C2H2-type domain-containing protein n=1 Tax=Mycena chlorophos TaxID=658473 RepID=A0ABQ0LBN1_MYCCL|nr:predicted protein [Mycena chlorophos]